MFRWWAASRCTRRCASLGVPTQLVVYPNSFHGITRPSYQKDRMERYLAWYNKYLKPAPAPQTTAPAAQ